MNNTPFKYKYWSIQDNDNLIMFMESNLKDQRLWLKLEPSLHKLIDGILNRYFVFNPSEYDYIITDVTTDLYLKLIHYDMERGSLFNFMTTVILNLLRNRFKKEKLNSERFIDEDVRDYIGEDSY